MKRIVFNIALLSAVSTVAAQTDADSTNTASATDTTIKRNIEVVRDYTPVIKEAGKINTMPELKDVNTKKIEIDYTIPNWKELGLTKESTVLISLGRFGIRPKDFIEKVGELLPHNISEIEDLLKFSSYKVNYI